MIVKVCADKTTLTNVVSISDITRMIDAIPLVTITLRDFEGTLYSTYADVAETKYYSQLQFQPIYVMNDAETLYLFIGRIVQVVFTVNSVILQCEGASGKLKDKPYSKNYVYASGKVKTVTYGADPDALELMTDDGDAFTWIDDYWFNDVSDCGILLTDATSGETSELWKATGRTHNPVSNVTMGDTFNDYTDSWTDRSVDLNAFEYGMEFQSQAAGAGNTEFTVALNPVGTGNEITYLKITVDMMPMTIYPGRGGNIALEIKKDGVWVELLRVWSWQRHEIIIPGDPTELAKYFQESGGNYTSIQIRTYIRGESVDYQAMSYGSINMRLYYLAAEIHYTSANFNPIQFSITDSGASSIVSDDAAFSNQGVVANDNFSIGENTRKILAEACAFSGIEVEIDTDFEFYMARNIKSIAPFQMMVEICEMEHAHWWEVYDTDGNSKIMVYKEASFEDSTESLTEANYRPNFQIELPANSYGKVHVYGNPYFSIEAIAIDPDSESPLEWTIINQSINTQTDAQQLANSVRDRLKDMRPSVILELIGNYETLEPGTTITVTTTKPAATFTDYPIRRIDFSQEMYAEDFKTRIYIGMGQSPPDEKLGKILLKCLSLSWKAQTDSISSPVVTGVPVISHDDLLNLSNDDHPQYHNDTRGDLRYAPIAKGVTNGDSHDHVSGDGNQIDHGGLAGLSDDDHTQYVKKAGDTMSGALAMGTNKITGLGDPTAAQDAVTRNYIATAIYPVGAIYISTLSTNPNTLLGFGTWAAFGAGKVLVGLDSSDADFDTVEETGGYKTHKHSLDRGVTWGTGTGSSGTNYYMLGQSKGSTAGALSTTDTGAAAGAQDNSLQPYIVVYMWKRTA